MENYIERDIYTEQLLGIVNLAGNRITYKEAIEMIDKLVEEKNNVLCNKL